MSIQRKSGRSTANTPRRQIVQLLVGPMADVAADPTIVREDAAAPATFCRTAF